MTYRLSIASYLWSVFFGLVFWLLAALFIRFTGPTLFSEATPSRLLLLIASIPVTYLFYWTANRIAAQHPDRAIQSVNIMAFVATIMDGIALTWFGDFYGPTAEIRLFGAAWLLWGVGTGSIFALIQSKKITVPSVYIYTKQYSILIGLGVGFWALGVVFVNILGEPLLLADGPTKLLPFLISIPNAFICIVIGRWLTKLPSTIMVRMMLIMSTAAIVLDGFALSLFPDLYHGDLLAQQLGSAWILFTFGIGFLVADLWEGIEVS